MNAKVVLKWTAIFLVLSIWTVVVIKGVPVGSVQTVNAASIDGQGPIYVADGDSLRQVTKSELLDALFFRDYELITKTEFVPSSKYSIRAKNSISEIGGIPAPGKNELSLNIVDDRNKGSRGSLIVQQNDGTRLSIDLDGIQIVENTQHMLKLSGVMTGKLDRQAVSGNVRVNVDKDAQTVTIVGFEGLNFRVENMPITLCQFCDTEIQQYTLIVINGDHEGTRSITEIRNELKDNPIILDEFKSLSVLNTPAWATIAPVFVS